MAGIPYPKLTGAPLPVVHLPAGETLSTGGLKVSLADIAVCTIRSEPVDRDQTIPGKVFDASLQPVPDGQRSFQGWEVAPGIVGVHTRWEIKGAESEKSQGVRSLGARIYDRRTHVLLGEDHHGGGKRGVSVNHAFKLQCWHQTPVRIVEDFVYGEPQVVELPLDPDSSFDSQRRLEIGDFVYTLSSFEEGKGKGGFSSSDGFWCTIDVDPPLAGRSMLGFRAIDSAGNDHGEIAFSPGDNLSSQIRIGFKKGDYRKLRVRVLPSVVRVVTDLKEIPGLPEENRGLTDLFDARIPVEYPPGPSFRSDWLIAGWVQLKQPSPDPRFGVNQATAEFETPREMLGAAIEQGFRYEIDPVAQQIEFSFASKNSSWLQRMLRKIF